MHEAHHGRVLPKKQTSGGAEAHETLPDASGLGHVVGEKDDAIFVDETMVAFRALAGRSQVLAGELCGLKRVKHRGLRDSKASCGRTTPSKD